MVIFVVPKNQLDRSSASGPNLSSRMTNALSSHTVLFYATSVSDDASHDSTNFENSIELLHNWPTSSALELLICCIIHWKSLVYTDLR